MSKFKPGVRRSTREGYVRGIRGRNYPRGRVMSSVDYPPPRSMELKGMDTALTLTALEESTNTNGDIIVANLVLPGSGSWNRIGRKIKMKSLRIWGSFKAVFLNDPTTGNIDGNIVRMVVVYDKNPNSGAIPTFDTIFGGTAQDGTESTAYLDPLKYDNMGRFQILKDCRYNLNPPGGQNASGGTTDYVSIFWNFDEYVKVGRETIYSGQSDPQTIADISSGALYVVFRAEEVNTTQIDVTSKSKCRLRS